ncbi:cholecystokinin B isoform X1 [Xenopus laevis]|uniref:Cholecystokinin B isoform X1 n=2 Tax=Xenopus laevis TaxID=8355 RepID=A0A1L8FWH8_XENLA|nr:cholecystokinin B isoform X1 [Xenopus laevis]XP_041421180.1 cholecystokinin B isoform X1 [Xenopus laevis]OCT75967.1 hypothetical protein XELAEV_18031153mg [Xenopus laevis]
MYSGVCICLLLAMLSASSKAHQATGSLGEDAVGTEMDQLNLSQLPRYARASSAGQKKSFQRTDGDQRSNIGNALVKYLQQSRKAGPSGRYVVLPNRPIFDQSHRINDRDYMGWMDFGRRSAEEYEYSS